MGDFELGTDGPTVVLAAVDGSRTSWRAVAYAAGLARRQGARLVVLHVSGGGAMSGFAVLVPGAAGPVATTAQEIAADIGRRVQDGAAETGLPLDYLVRRGDPLAEITRVADEVRAEVVVVGASESAGHRFVPSIADRLVRAARWPVTVVP